MASGKIETLSKRVTVNGIIDHAKLINKHLDNQHPISAISGLQEELNKLKSGTTQQVEDLNTVVEQARLDLQKTAVAIQKESATKVELNNAETSLKAELNEVETEIKGTLKDTEAELKEDLKEVQTSLKSDITSLDGEFSEKLESLKELSDNKYSTKAEFVTLSDRLTSVLLEVDEDMADLQRTTTDQMTDLQEATTEQITTLKETNDLKFSDLQKELDNRFEEVGTKITMDIQPKLDNLAIDISTVETNLSNTSNIYHTKTAEAPAVPLDEVLTELYQGSGNAKNITYTSGEDEKPLNEVIDELYQGSGSAENISYTKDKTVQAAISDLETNLGAAADEADKQFKEIDDRLTTVLEYINTLHPLTITISKGSSTTKHFSDSGNISVEWKTNRGIGESTMVFSDALGSETCSPKNTPSSPAEAVTYTHTWSPYNNIKDTLTQASASGKVEAQATISIAGLNIEKSISCTYTHYVYCGMLNKPFGEIPNLSQSITASLNTIATRFLQATSSLSNKTYKATTGGGYLYYVAPISYVAGKTLVVDFGIGKTYLNTYNTTTTLKFGDLNVEYAVYQITNDLQNGDVTAAISVQN